MKVVVIGNSVGLRVRPAASDFTRNFPFSEHLKLSSSNIEIKNLCRGRHLIEELLNEREEYIREFPDIYIVNVGITDVCNREIPLWYSNIITRSKRGFFRNFLMLVYVFFIKKMRRTLVFIRGKKPWRTLDFSIKKFDHLVVSLIKDTSARIIVLSVLDVDKRVENILPGSNENISCFNKKLKRVIDTKCCSRIRFLDLSNSVDQFDRPDGIHLNDKGHQSIAEALLECIKLW